VSGSWHRPNTFFTFRPSFATTCRIDYNHPIMKFIHTPIPDLLLIEPKAFVDPRGFFAEVYRADLFEQNGIRQHFVQDNHSSSARGTLRGLHCQIAPKAQAKLIRVVYGEIFDVAVDVRAGSDTYGKWHGEILSAENRKMLFVPEGFLHGFLVTSDHAEVIYQTTDYYSPKDERGVAWNDSDINVSWPDPGCPLILSDRDRKTPFLKNAGPF
jgi:dTDP-4-dehydrorhamnose 3,5-epimerase